ncbi:Anucleate primary sterigmata protein A [Ceratocystis platani]|uniref:Anucleate primary sterigmata protein A n=1 Tax=Ceratocystis fimbriata f. sp. platani TaxID=88771 RepID=A0A0F8AZW5_CERFI|nr:Anucleate primary sterigmata protein A [Ceratocystis platani]
MYLLERTPALQGELQDAPILDPRRFTPTLHANLVSEILTLRRDQEEKIKLIEQLESALHVSRQEQEVLEQTVVNTSKETRAVKRQLSLLEGGTSTAIGDLAKERDEAVETSAETKKKLETAQRKIKTQEEDSQRVHNQWAKEKNEWEEERRKFERKIHISESRLKIILDEVAAYEAQQQSQAAQGSNSDIDDGTDRENDSASIRSQRPASVTNSVRFSIISNRGLNSLADELDFGGDDEWIEYDDRRESLISINNAFRHSRTFSKDSTLSMTKGHARTQSIQSIDSLRRPSSGARGTLLQSTPVIEAPEDDISVNGTITGGDEDLDVLGIDESMADVTVLERPMTPPSEISIEYVDTGVQFSPPSSPKLEAIMGDVISIPAVAIKMKMTRASVVFSRSDAEIEANQRRLTDVQSVTSQTTGVVDAIAQTMIGEWMFKYVRRRKSFGVPESSNREEPSNDRHKRWVWLAPYERAILWSSKQPSSNSILMGGKAGRKLLIQSVLDVKDDNPAPKGATQLFNRSILILTPQRALKFTAVSAERHYLWLTALSFLAHSSQAIPENLVPPKPDLVSFEMPPPSSSGNTWAGSQRTSEASSRPSNNFFDAIGTVRMEAFISPLAYSQFDDDPDENDEFRASARRRSKEMRRRNSRSRNRDSYNSRWSGSRTGGEEDFFSRDDPFKGF